MVNRQNYNYNYLVDEKVEPPYPVSPIAFIADINIKFKSIIIIFANRLFYQISISFRISYDYQHYPSNSVLNIISNDIKHDYFIKYYINNNTNLIDLCGK